MHSEPHREFRCERCYQIAVFTADMASKLDHDSDETPANLLRPALCPRCSADESLALLEFDEIPNEQTVVKLIDDFTLREAEQHIAGCVRCYPEAEITFDYILDAITGCDPTNTDYVLYRPAKCPRCLGVVKEKTLVAPDYI